MGAYEKLLYCWSVVHLEDNQLHAAFLWLLVSVILGTEALFLDSEL